MGRYVYIKDKEIKVIGMALDNLAENTGEYNDYIADIETKLSQRTKTLEEEGFKLISAEPQKITYENHYGINAIIERGNITFCGAYTITELEAILNKARELFEEKNDDSNKL